MYYVYNSYVLCIYIATTQDDHDSKMNFFK